MYALLDCDNFFVSCERLFRPKLKNRPVVVLSNNDGCVVSRSYEAKAIGIPMGAPYFKIESLLQAHNGIACSSNYALYADISGRIMQTLRQMHQELEVYSIDEAFIRLTSQNPGQEALNLRNLILKNIGISVSVGIAATKTLCKAAADIAKKKAANKIFFLNNQTQIDNYLQSKDISEIWGIGRHLKPKLNFMGIFNALELKQTSLRLIKQKFGLGLEKVVLELNGHAVLTNIHEENQSLICSGSFEKEIRSVEKLEQILADYTARVCLRLRQHNLLASGITTFVETNRFSKSHPFYHNSASSGLHCFSSNTALFIKAMKENLRQICPNGLAYKRAGVMLQGIQEADCFQQNLFTPAQESGKEEKLMKICDKLNSTLGARTIVLGAQSLRKEHISKSSFRSQISTTSWQDFPQVA